MNKPYCYQDWLHSRVIRNSLESKGKFIGVLRVVLNMQNPFDAKSHCRENPAIRLKPVIKKNSNKKPSISVIITAHDRQQFLIKAVKSVLNSTLDRSFFEIIIVKNFYNEEIDSYLSTEGIKIIQTQEIVLGAKIVLGIENSSSDIIAFLEDDDIYYPEKMSEVMKVFRDMDIGYYHHNYSLIDSDGNKLFGSLGPRRTKKPLILRPLKDGYNWFNSIRKAVAVGGFFNLSCIAIKKEIILETINELIKLQVAVDNYMFYLSLDSKFSLFIDNKILVNYRVHDTNASIARTSSFAEFKYRKRIFLESDILGYQIIKNSTRNRIINDFISCRILLPHYALSIIKRSDGIYLLTPNYPAAIKCALKMRSFELLLLLIAYLISRLNQNWGVILYYNYENRKITSLLYLHKV